MATYFNCYQKIVRSRQTGFGTETTENKHLESKARSRFNNALNRYIFNFRGWNRQKKEDISKYFKLKLKPIFRLNKKLKTKTLTGVFKIKNVLVFDFNAEYSFEYIAIV